MGGGGEGGVAKPSLERHVERMCGASGSVHGGSSGGAPADVSRSIGVVLSVDVWCGLVYTVCVCARVDHPCDGGPFQLLTTLSLSLPTSSVEAECSLLLRRTTHYTSFTLPRASAAFTSAVQTQASSVGVESC